MQLIQIVQHPRHSGTFVLNDTRRPNAVSHSVGKQEMEKFDRTLTLLVSLDIDIPESIGIEKSLVVKDQC